MTAESSQKRKLLPEHVPELREFLQTVPERTRMTSLEAVREMKDDIRELQEKGYSLSDIGDLIEKQGFDLPLSTFRNYLKQTGYRKNPTKKAPDAKPRGRGRSSKKQTTSDTTETPRPGTFCLLYTSPSPRDS